MECSVCQKCTELSDLELAALFNEGVREAAAILFSRHYEFLEHMSHNTVDLPRTDHDDKRGIVYQTFVEAIPQYAGTNGASLRTYLKRCIKNDLLDTKRRMKAQKRRGELKTVSLCEEGVNAAVEERIFEVWRTDSQRGRF